MARKTSYATFIIIALLCLIAINPMTATHGATVYVTPPPTQPSTSTIELQITHPQNEETIYYDEGKVPVIITTGSYLLPHNHTIVLYLDGKIVALPSTSPSLANNSTLTITIENVERGTHTLFAHIANEHHTVLATTPTITFFMRHHSIVPSTTSP